MADSQQAHAVPGEIIISDLDQRIDPALMNADDLNSGYAESYDAESFSGVMVAPGLGTDPKALTIRLGQKGLYRIWLGMFAYSTSTNLRVRLTKDRACGRVSFPRGATPWAASVYEVCWKEADLTGQDLILEGSCLHSPHNYAAALAYIRLEPLTELPASATSIVQHPMTISCDGYGIFGDMLYSRPDDLAEWFERIPANAPVRTLLWGCAQSDLCNWPSKVGHPFNFGEGTYQDRFLDMFQRNLDRWRERGWNSLEVIRDYCSSRSWDFVPYIRMEAFNAHFPFMHIRSRFFTDHPEYHCRDREGGPVGRLSYAFPEVQDHMIDLFTEIASYNPDGLCLCFIRGVPLVLFEGPMVEGFRAKHGKDPRKLDEFDPLWLRYQAGVLNSFVRRVKEALGPKCPLTAIVPANQYDCLRWGLDPAAWVRDGLIDELYPTGQRFNDLDVHKDAPDHLNYAYFDNLPGRDRIKLTPLLYPWDMFNADFPQWEKFTRSFLEQGADGYAVWDAVEPVSRLLRTAHIGCAPGTYANPPAPASRVTKLVRVQGFRFNRYHHFEVV